jgi:hypothetical protein
LTIAGWLARGIGEEANDPERRVIDLNREPGGRVRLGLRKRQGTP